MPAFSSSGKWMIAAALVAVACSHDWDTYDPRLGEKGDASLGGKPGGGGGTTTGGGGAKGGGGTPAGGGTTAGGGSSGSGGLGGGGGIAGGGGSVTGGVAGTAGVAGSGGVLSGGGTSGGGGTAGGGTGGTTTGGGGTGGTLTQKDYAASVADCTSLTTPNPDICMSYTYNVGMSVDLVNASYAVADASAGEPTAVFLRFDLDAAFAGKTVTQVTLTLNVTSNANAGSNSSGEVWRVNCFTRQDLSSAIPAKIGTTAIAPAQGPIVANQAVSWLLPVSTVSASQPCCLGIFPKTSDGADYYNNTGAKPASLSVLFQ